VSLRTRLLAAFAYVLVLVIVALEVPLALNLSRRVDAEIKSEAQGQAALLAAGVSNRLEDRRELRAVLTRAASDLGGRVIVVGPRGRLLADSAGTGLGSASYASRPEVARALGGQADQGTRHSDTLGEDVLFTAVPVVRGDRTIGAVRVTQSVDEVQREVRSDTLALVGVGALALLLGLGVAWLLAGSLARPLRALAGTARSVAGGDLDARAAPEGSSEQREVASAFNDMTDRLGRSLRAQREFVANASHQLRTPLTGLRLRLESAELKSSDPEVRRDLAAAEHETVRLAALLSRLLTLVRESEAEEGELLNLAEEVEAAHARWDAPAGQSGHELRFERGAGVMARSSRADVAAVLDNLVENALNYSPAGTTVTLGLAGDATWARVSVSDEGPGVAAGEGERVFERFYRGSGSTDTEGTGLGLAVVEALAKRWGGEASLVNREPRGARAEVRLPAATLPSPDLQLDEALPGAG
jgi:two-component system, OmpR family, sensor kinase